jgi:hypothetical protein
MGLSSAFLVTGFLGSAVGDSTKAVRRTRLISELAAYLRVISFGKFLEGIVVQSPAGSAVYFFAL